MPQAAFCLSLSREASRRIVLSVYLPDGASLAPQVAETLKSMGAGLAVALDRASLRAREQQLLQQVERTVKTERLGLIPTLEHILADISTPSEKTRRYSMKGTAWRAMFTTASLSHWDF